MEGREASFLIAEDYLVQLARMDEWKLYVNQQIREMWECYETIDGKLDTARDGLHEELRVFKKSVEAHLSNIDNVIHILQQELLVKERERAEVDKKETVRRMEKDAEEEKMRTHIESRKEKELENRLTTVENGLKSKMRMNAIVVIGINVLLLTGFGIFQVLK
jgi:phosphoenolpyruvate carboxylase